MFMNTNYEHLFWFWTHSEHTYSDFSVNISLTHCRLNELPHNICWKIPILILGMSGIVIQIFLEKKGEHFANNGDLDQKPNSAVSNLGLHCLPITFIGVNIYINFNPLSGLIHQMTYWRYLLIFSQLIGSDISSKLSPIE